MRLCKYTRSLSGGHIFRALMEAPYGDALLAAKGVGAVEDFDVINDWLTFDPPIDPNTEWIKIYDEYYREWKALYEALKEPFARLPNLP